MSKTITVGHGSVVRGRICWLFHQGKFGHLLEDQGNSVDNMLCSVNAASVKFGGTYRHPSPDSLRWFFAALFLFTLNSPKLLFSQDLTAKDIAMMSFDELLNHEIVSASKEAESVFEAPLSATVLTQEEISRAGATSIPEALRLVPGVIVREQTNGNYDVHIRGFDYLPQGSVYTNSTNNLSLVMIDNRVVYNYLSGGVFWETLPVDINDIDRIEIIRGPVSSLYGPNAVTGVIHIITKTQEEQGTEAEVHVEGGSHRTGIARSSVGYRSEEGHSIRISANGQSRERNNVEYYLFSEGEFSSDISEGSFLTNPRPVDNVDRRYPNEKRSLHRGAVNVFLEGKISETETIDLDLGLQDSQAKNVFHDVEFTPITNSETDSYYIHARGNLEDTQLIFSLTDGEQDVSGASAFDFNFTTYDASADHLLRLTEDLSLRPGLAYRRVEYGGGSRFEQEDPALDLFSGSLRSEYNYNDWTFIAAGRGDKYDHQSKVYLSYQAVISHRLSADNIIRAHYGRAFRSPFMEDTFQVVTFPVNEGLQVVGRGNENLSLLRNDTYELGWRTRFSEQVEMDIEAFWGKNKNYSEIFADGTVDMNNGVTSINFPFQRIPLEAEQYGGTLALLFSSESWSARLFGTLQKTHLRDSLADPTHPSSIGNATHDNTPDYYGGFYLNWNPEEDRRWNINLNSYLIGDTRQLSRSARIIEDDPTRVSSKWILSSKISYELTDELEIFVNARNLLNNDSREYANADKIDALYLAGFELSL